jgi:hypothetical protein
MKLILQIEDALREEEYSFESQALFFNLYYARRTIAFHVFIWRLKKKKPSVQCSYVGSMA